MRVTSTPRSSTSVPVLVLGAGLLVLACRQAVTSTSQAHFAVFWLGFVLVLAATLVAGLRARSTAGALVALVAYGIATMLPKASMTWSGPRYFDEYGHWRHANDIASSHHLSVATPYLPIQRDYPGLEVLTAVLHWVTRISTWHAGQLIVLVAHCGVLVAIWWLCRLLDLPRRAAFVAAIAYSLNSSYLFFDTQYSYESLGLPLCVTAVALAVASRRADTQRRAWGFGALAFIVAAACVTVHHTSSLVLAGVLLATVVFVPARERTTDRGAATAAPWAAALASIAVLLLWLTTVARPTYGYIEPHVRAGVTDALNFLRGRTRRTFDAGGSIETRRTLFAGTTLPVYEIVCAFLTPPIVLAAFVAIVAGVRRSGRFVRGLRPLAPFHALVVLYFISLPLALTLTGSETAHRAWAFGYIGVAVVVASGEAQWDRLAARVPGRRLQIGACAVLLVVAIGNIAAGENVYYRFPGPSVFGSDTRSRTPELDDLATWLRTHVRAGEKVVTDRFTGEAVIGYTKLIVPAPDDYLVYRLYLEGGKPDPRLRTYLRRNDFRYFVLDRRIGHLQPVQKLFPGYVGPVSVSPDALAAAGTTPFLRSIHRTATYDVLEIR